MSKPPTPRGALTLYRQNMDEFTAEQLKQFMAMPASERMELLFLMIMNTNAGVRHVHSLIDPSVAIEDMPDPDPVN